MYGSYSCDFRAPALVENSQPKTLSIRTASDPLYPSQPGVPQSINELTNGKPNPQPERTKNYATVYDPSLHPDIGRFFQVLPPLQIDAQAVHRLCHSRVRP